MDEQHTQQTNRLERDITGLGTRLDRHLEVYANNGKEIAAMNANLKTLEVKHDNFSKLLTSVERNMNDVSVNQQLLTQTVEALVGVKEKTDEEKGKMRNFWVERAIHLGLWTTFAVLMATGILSVAPPF